MKIEGKLTNKNNEPCEEIIVWIKSSSCPVSDLASMTNKLGEFSLNISCFGTMKLAFNLGEKTKYATIHVTERSISEQLHFHIENLSSSID